MRTIRARNVERAMAPVILVIAVAMAGCGGGGGKDAPKTATPPPAGAPPATSPASSSATSPTSRYQRVRSCLNKAQLLTSEAVAQGASAKGIIANPGGDIFFYQTAADAAKDLPAIRRREGSSKPASLRGAAIFAYEKTLDADGSARKKIEGCLKTM